MNTNKVKVESLDTSLDTLLCTSLNGERVGETHSLLDASLDMY